MEVVILSYTKDGKYVPIHERATITLGALAANSAEITTGPTMVQNVFITRSDIAMTICELPQDNAGGPLLIGIADRALSGAEIEECIEADGPLHERDNLLDEQSRRRVQYIDVLNPFENCEHTGSALQLLPYGKFVKHNTRMKFTEDSAGWTWWAYNLGNDAFTTGGLLKLVVLHHARWLP